MAIAPARKSKAHFIWLRGPLRREFECQLSKLVDNLGLAEQFYKLAEDDDYLDECETVISAADSTQ